MLHRCPNCPVSNTLLQHFLFHTIGDFDDDATDFLNGKLLISLTFLTIQKLLTWV